MKNLRRKCSRFLYNNSDKGIPNLMLFISLGTLLSYLIILADKSGQFFNFICFNRDKILHGQVWRLITYVFVPQNTGFWLFLLLFAYYGIGRMVERTWGTLKFNLFYLSGVLIMDIAALLFHNVASPYYLNLSLFLAMATLYPENRVLLFYIIPIKMKYLAWVYLLIVVAGLVQLDFFPVFALLNYFLFFGRDFLNVLPDALTRKLRGRPRQKPNPNWARSYQKQSSGRKSGSGARSGSARVVDAPAYRHRCTVCGRTDVSNPELEFRYCSRCNGYYCYCQEHINDHAHIQ